MYILVKDTTGEATKDEESQDLLKKLEDGTLTENIPANNIFNYEVNWQSNEGISPDSNPSHREYLTKLCQDAEQRLRSLCQRAFTQRARTSTRDPLFQEALQHVTFCQSKCESFHGRADSLKLIEDYLRGPATHPLVIHGPSGCGKTSLLAMAAKLSHTIHAGKSITIIRFIGTTPESTTLPALLSSVFQQLMKAALISSKLQNPAASTTRVLGLQLFLLLGRVAKVCPVVLLLDSLDQFDPSHDARHLAWLPTKLAPNVKVIVSTLPDPQYEAFPVLQAKFKDVPGSMLEVPELNEMDITSILDQWLAAAGRKLTQAQRFSVLDAFQNCPLPLFLRLSFDEACKWKSFSRPELSILQPTIRDCINRLFTQMEVSHGKVFVSRALGYLTTSESGLSEAELEDILSCDNQVLGDVYRFWTPPVRRLPPLLLVRMKRDLADYVVNRGADNKQVFYWYHRQFIEAARERYCSGPDTVKDFHDGLAHFFAGTWGDGNPKPFFDNKGNEMSADRHVTSQPLKLGEEFNTRKLGNQAFHRNRSHNLVLLKSECLLNLDFLKAKIACLGVRSVLDDFHDARLTFPGVLALEGVGDALQLSQSALAYDVRLLPSQLLGRIRSKRIRSLAEVSALLTSCESPGEPYLEPDRPVLEAAGGMLVHSIAGHSDSISAMVVNRAGTVAVTCE
ncbi:NACHT and WD repeat domain-containing protein 1 [Elysia marginata]|uniref:NACHT and WD repeat domain-containing protein 1 n=1 Tax=Elysia marginata TaxID=1093978 RepID=A0AAV4FFG6_9GAST|nr:NACHT and WD repeat domain-containing protein 1 [Elysia marginata]